MTPVCTNQSEMMVGKEYYALGDNWSRDCWYLIKQHFKYVMYRENLSCVQGNYLYVAGCFWNLVKSDLSSKRYFYSVTFYKVPEQHSNDYLVGLYKPTKSPL